MRALEDEQILDAGHYRRGSAPNQGRPRKALLRTHALEDMIVRSAGRLEAAPAVLLHRHLDAGRRGSCLEEMAREQQRELLGLAEVVLARLRVDRVLHGIGRKYRAVVTLDVGRRELPRQRDIDREIANLVTPAGGGAHDLEESDGRLAVAVARELGGHRSAAAVRGVPEGTEQQRHVVVLGHAGHAEYDRDLRIQCLSLGGSEIGAGVEAQTIGACAERLYRAN